MMKTVRVSVFVVVDSDPGQVQDNSRKMATLHTAGKLMLPS